MGLQYVCADYERAMGGRAVQQLSPASGAEAARGTTTAARNPSPGVAVLPSTSRRTSHRAFDPRDAAPWLLQNRPILQPTPGKLAVHDRRSAGRQDAMVTL